MCHLVQQPTQRNRRPTGSREVDCTLLIDCKKWTLRLCVECNNGFIVQNGRAENCSSSTSNNGINQALINRMNPATEAPDLDEDRPIFCAYAQNGLISAEQDPTTN